MILIAKQKQFTRLVVRLLDWLDSHGYEVTFGETWRPPETARKYEEEGKGIPNSLHCIRLAIDLNVFRDGKLLTRSDEYREIGEYWESLSTPDCECAWGGRWGDGNHFSIAHLGVR